MAFKQGDVILCIYAGDVLARQSFRVGECYTVVRDKSNEFYQSVYVEEIPNPSGWSTPRFLSVKDLTPVERAVYGI